MHKNEKGWTDEQFQPLRMEDKIEFLKDYLPQYLVEIRKIYKIFSLGIHELENKRCLEFFEIGKRSIIFILEDDLKKQEEERVRKELAESIAKFAPPTREMEMASQKKK